jgi:hypothetical protein
VRICGFHQPSTPAEIPAASAANLHAMKPMAHLPEPQGTQLTSTAAPGGPVALRRSRLVFLACWTTSSTSTIARAVSPLCSSTKSFLPLSTNHHVPRLTFRSKDGEGQSPGATPSIGATAAPEEEILILFVVLSAKRASRRSDEGCYSRSHSKRRPHQTSHR